MKYILPILITAGVALGQSTTEYSNERALRALQQLQGLQQPQPDIYNQLRAIEIRTAYPDNPQMWRYLERNPRYQPYYLGY